MENLYFNYEGLETKKEIAINIKNEVNGVLNQIINGENEKTDFNYINKLLQDLKKVTKKTVIKLTFSQSKKLYNNHDIEVTKNGVKYYISNTENSFQAVDLCGYVYDYIKIESEI